MLHEFLPLLVALFVVGVLALSAFSRPIDRAVTRLAYLIFRGGEVTIDRRHRELRSAGIGTPFRIYVIKTRLYTAVGALVGSVLGVYAAASILAFLSVSELGTLPILDTLSSLPGTLRTDTLKRFAVYLTSSVLLGGLSAAVVYTVRWQIPSMRADTRRRQIDATMPRMVAFIYALSRGGMAFPDVMRALSRNRGE